MDVIRLRNMTAIYLTRGERVLLLYRIGSRVVGDSYTGSAGGHFEPEELNDPQACVLRELAEETGLTADALTGFALRYITMRLKNDEIRQNYYYFAELKDGFTVDDSNEGRLRWVDWSEVNALPQPVTAWHVTDHYRRVGRHTDVLYGGVTTEAGTVFTELQDF